MIISSIEQLKNFIMINMKTFARSRQILLLEGEMGSGKTEFVKQLVGLMGGAIATSPSFAIHNSYETKSIPVEHLDLYRLASEDELQSIGFWDLFENDSALIVIEWAERVDIKRLPMTWQTVKIKFEILGESGRKLTLSGGL